MSVSTERDMSIRKSMKIAYRMARQHPPTTCVAYGVPVSLEILGARLEAHKECRAALTAFEHCIQNLPRLPLEVWRRYVKEVQQAAYEEKLEWWKAANECCKNVCKHGDDKDGSDKDAHDGHGDPLKMMAKIIRCRKV